MTSLVVNQTNALSNMLTSQSSSSRESASTGSKWRVLVYDVRSRSIISPLFTVPTLHEKGVTLHMLIDSKREAIPDVPAIYFCRPTEANIDIIAGDIISGLYSSFRLHFTTKLSRELMERLAGKLVKGNAVGLVEGIWDEFCDFVSLERGVFSLNEPGAYALYNSPSTPEAAMNRLIDGIALGLFSVVCTWGKVPIIRCKGGGIAEAVARKLSSLIVENPILNDLKASREANANNNNSINNYNYNNSGNNGIHSRRPLMVIADRNDDLTPLLAHSSTYQALLSDLLPHTNNKVVCENDGKSQTFYLDPDKDPFYKENKFRSYPEAIESNGEELKNITEKEAEVRAKAGGAGATGETVVTSMDENESKNALSSAVESLPALLERKKQVRESKTN